MVITLMIIMITITIQTMAIPIIEITTIGRTMVIMEQNLWTTQLPFVAHGPLQRLATYGGLVLRLLWQDQWHPVSQDLSPQLVQLQDFNWSFVDAPGKHEVSWNTLSTQPSLALSPWNLPCPFSQGHQWSKPPWIVQRRSSLSSLLDGFAFSEIPQHHHHQRRGLVGSFQMPNHCDQPDCSMKRLDHGKIIT